MLSLERVADIDRQWFQDHPDRRYRARYAALPEQKTFGADPDLVLLIRHLGRGTLVYQPVRLAAPPPADVRMLAQLFARAVADPRPVPALALPKPLAEAAEPAG